MAGMLVLILLTLAVGVMWVFKNMKMRRVEM